MDRRIFELEPDMNVFSALRKGQTSHTVVSCPQCDSVDVRRGDMYVGQIICEHCGFRGEGARKTQPLELALLGERIKAEVALKLLETEPGIKSYLASKHDCPEDF